MCKQEVHFKNAKSTKPHHSTPAIVCLLRKGEITRLFLLLLISLSHEFWGLQASTK